MFCKTFLFLKMKLNCYFKGLAFNYHCSCDFKYNLNIWTAFFTGYFLLYNSKNDPM